MINDATGRRHEAFKRLDQGLGQRALLTMLGAILLELERIADALEKD